MPLRLTPPKGIRGSDAVIALTKTMPASMSALSFSARSRSCGPEAGAEAELGVVGERDRGRLVGDAGDRGDRAEGLFAQHRRARGGIGADHGRLVPGARLVGGLAAGEDAGARRLGGADDPGELVAQVLAGHRAELGLGVERGAAAQALGRVGEALLELVGDRLDDDEPLRRDAALAGVLEARGDRDLDRLLEVGVVEHDEGVGAAELEHRRLDRPPGRFADRDAGGVGAGQGDAGDPPVADQLARLAAGDDDRLEDARRGARPLEGLLQQQSRSRSRWRRA